MQPGQELLQKWDARARELRPSMEITDEGLTLGAGTMLAGMAQDERGAPAGVALDDEPRVMALLATAYEQPVAAYVLGKMRRAAELWNEGEKALAHIHLAHAGLPPCREERALRLFVADELIEAGSSPAALMEAQGFDSAPLDLLKANFNPDQPRVPAGSRRESGEWTDGASIDTAGVTDFLARLALEAARRAARALLSSKTKPANPEVAKPETKPLEAPEAEQLPDVDANKLHHIFDNPEHPFGDFVSQYGSEEAAFRAIEDATRKALQEQHITGKYRIEIEVGGRRLIVKGNVLEDGTVKFGTAYPW
ncbi:MAG: hypothetical protein ACREC9_12635 [Methylocella sp.]